MVFSFLFLFAVIQKEIKGKEKSILNFGFQSCSMVSVVITSNKAPSSHVQWASLWPLWGRSSVAMEREAQEVGECSPEQVTQELEGTL